MSSAPTAPPASKAPISSPSAGERQARLKLKPDGATTGFVDGAWWPRSRDLQQELPALLAGLHQRLGPVEAVSYHLGDWSSPPRRTSIAGVSVRIGGYRLQRAGSLDVIARNRRVTLLVIDPEQSQEVAEQALIASAELDNIDDLDTLLTYGARTATSQKDES